MNHSNVIATKNNDIPINFLKAGFLNEASNWQTADEVINWFIHTYS